MRHNYTEPRLAGKDQSHLHLGHPKLFRKYFWALVPVNPPSDTEHFYTDTTKVGNLWLIWVLDNGGSFKSMLCAAGCISPFPFMLWQCTQDWHKTLQIFKFIFSQSSSLAWLISYLHQFWHGKNQTRKLMAWDGRRSSSICLENSLDFNCVESNANLSYCSCPPNKQDKQHRKRLQENKTGQQ